MPPTFPGFNPRDVEDFANLCGATLALILLSLTGAKPITSDHTWRREENCDFNLPPAAAAIAYATTAQQYWQIGGVAIKVAENRFDPTSFPQEGKWDLEAPLVVTVTRAKLPSGKCQGYVAVSSIQDYLNKTTFGSPSNRKYARNRVAMYQAGLAAIYVTGTGLGNEVFENVQTGVDGHAERALIERVGRAGGTMNAIGVSKAPCLGRASGRIGCNEWFRNMRDSGSTLQVGFWNEDTDLPEVLKW